MYILHGPKGKVHLGPNVSSSAHDRGCVVNGSGAMAAIIMSIYIYYIYIYIYILLLLLLPSGGKLLGSHPSVLGDF